MSSWRLSEDPAITLGRYHAEVARGIVHTDEWCAEMIRLQQVHDEMERDRMIQAGMTDVGHGIWMTSEPCPRPWWRRWSRRDR